MATGKITQRAVDALAKHAKEHAKGVYLWDTELRGFGCRAAPSGQVSWLFQHWIGGQGGRPNRLAFAHYPGTRLEAAREQAEKLRGDVANGIDVVSRKDQIRKEKREALKATKLEILTNVGLPRTMPYFFASLKVAVTQAFVGTVIAETVASNRGIGNLMMIASSSFDVPLVFAGLLVLAVLGVALYVIFSFIEVRVTGWALRKDEFAMG